MVRVTRIACLSCLLAATAAHADDDVLEPPSSVPAAEPTPVHVRASPLATTEPWGGGVRITGLSGIGALPGVNYGGELAGYLRHNELFGELALARWKPEHTYVVTETPEHIELGLDVWTVRAGWASMAMPLRAWFLVEVGELAGMRQMPGVVARMMTGDTPQDRRWHAAGAGFGVAWPMADSARLFGSVEFAVPGKNELMLQEGSVYQPEVLVARANVGLEVGWR